MGKKVRITIDEIMCSVAAREIKDGERVFVGQGYPILAAMLAKKRHAPNAILVMEGGLIDFEPHRPPLHIADFTAMKGVSCSCDMVDTFACYLFRGDIDVGFLGAAQIDPYGNINSTVIGEDHSKPRRRFPGSGGANDVASFCWRTVIIMKHEKERFVGKIDFVTSPGYLDGPGAREKAGLPRGTGPYRVITSMGVFGFDEKNKYMKLLALAPGYTTEDILNNMGFEPLVAETVEKLEPPTAEELRLLREEIDPERAIIGKV